MSPTDLSHMTSNRAVDRKHPDRASIEVDGQSIPLKNPTDDGSSEPSRSETSPDTPAMKGGHRNHETSTNR